MILKCIGGPLDGAAYQLDLRVKDIPRLPDGMWFRSRDEHGRPVQEQYNFSRNTEFRDTIYVAYEYDGKLVDVHDPGIAYSNPEDMEHDERPGIVGET